MKYVRHTKRKMTKTVKILLIVLSVVLVLNISLVIAVLRMQKQDNLQQNPSTTLPQESTSTQPTSESVLPTQGETTIPEPAYLEFPYAIEDGKLTVVSLFGFTGYNPDCNDAEGENIAGIEVKNTSESHLTNAVITAFMADGTDLNFMIVDLPPGASVMAFSTDNAQVEDASICESIVCEAAFEEKTPLMEEALAIEVEATNVTVTNVSNADLVNLTIYCHCSLDPEFFGGLTYSYKIESLTAGESITVDAWECYLGEAVVVRIMQDG